MALQVKPEAQVVQPVNPVPPHCPYWATAHAPGATGLDVAPLDVLAFVLEPAAAVVVARVVGALLGALVATAPDPGVLSSAPEQGAPADLVEPPEYTVGPGAS